MSGKKIGHTAETAVTVCNETQPGPDQVLATSSNAASDGQHADWTKIRRVHIDEREIPPWAPFFFGFGAEGSVDFDGTSTVLGIAPSGSVYTLTKDINPSIIHVRSGVRIKTNGYRLRFADTLYLYGSAQIDADGGNGGDGSGASAGAKGDPQGGGTLGGGSAGGIGGAGGAAPNGVGGNGASGNALTEAKGSRGGPGSSGQTSGGAGGLAGAAGTIAADTITDIANFVAGQALQTYDTDTSAFVRLTGGTGGGGGGGGGADASNAGGGAGGGGGGGGILMIAGPRIVGVAWTGRISANGGDAGDGATTAAGDGGAGGPGGGGAVVVQCVEMSGVSPGQIAANAGAAGTNGYGGTGNTATDGVVVLLCLTQPNLPPDFTQTTADELAAMHLAAEPEDFDYTSYETGTEFDYS